MQIRQIEQFDYATVNDGDVALLQMLEEKISHTILPIRSRLSAKLNEVKIQIKSRSESMQPNEMKIDEQTGAMYMTSTYMAPIYPTEPYMATPHMASSYMTAIIAPAINIAPTNILNPPPEKKKRKRYPKKAVGAIVSGDSDKSLGKNRAAQHSPSGISDNLSVKSLDQITCLNDPDVNENGSDSGFYEGPHDMYCYDMGFASDVPMEMMFVGQPFDIIPDDHVISALPVKAKQEVAISSMHASVSSVEEYISPKRRRRLNQIVPNPRKPRSAQYQCSRCSESYLMSVQENPWWAVFVHECPSCKVSQVPRLDINLACNAIDLDPNIVALYGEEIGRAHV